MSLDYPQCEALIAEVNSALSGATYQFCQELHPQQWLLSFSKGDALERLLVSLQHPFIRFHLSSRPRKKKSSTISQSIDLRLHERTVEKVEMLNSDRILAVQFTDGFRLIVHLFPKRPNLFIIDEAMQIRYALTPVKESVYEFPIQLGRELTDITVPSVCSRDVEQRYDKAEQQAKIDQAKKGRQQGIKRLRRRLQQKKSRLIEEVTAGESWQEVQHEGEMLQTYFAQIKQGQHEIIVEDWVTQKPCVLEIDPTKTPQDNVKARFKRARKLRGSLERAQLDMPAVASMLTELENAESTLAETVSYADLDDWDKTYPQWVPKEQLHKREIEKKRLHPFREYRTATGMAIFVGKSARDNDELTFKFARGSDWWLHVADYPGSHVLLRPTRRDTEPDNASLQDAMQIALHYSKARVAGSGEVVVTQRKFVGRAGKNAPPGKVTVSQHKKMYVQLDNDRFQELKHRGESS